MVVVGEVHCGSIRDLYFPGVYIATGKHKNRRHMLEKSKNRFLKTNQINAIYAPVTANSLREASSFLLQATGYPNLRPNTLVLRFLDELPELVKNNQRDTIREYVGIIEDISF